MADEIVFVGRHDEKLGPDGTFTMPDEWRSGITEGRVVYILPDRDGRCLNLVPDIVMERELANIRTGAKVDAADQEALRVIGEAMYQIVADNEWRVEIPQRLRETFGIADEVALIGSIRMIKIWAKPALDEMEIPEEFEKLLEDDEEEKRHGKPL